MERKFSYLLLVICSLFTIGSHYATADNVNSLKALCGNGPISLESLHQTRQLIEQVKTTGLEVCSRYRNSLLDLDELLAVVQSGKTPNLEFVQMVRDYHEKYIADENDRVRDNIPLALRRFFISLCFQISAEFKINLINSLEVDAKELIQESDYNLINLLDTFGATLSDGDTEINDFDDIILLDDLNRAAGIKQEKEMQLMIKVKTSEMMRDLVQACNTKFRPIYDKLILPLIGLSNMGYNYQGELLKVELEELKKNPIVKRWYVIVQTCETFKSIEIFETNEPITDGDRQTFIFVQEEEAEELRKNQKALYDPKEMKPIEYQPVTSHNDHLWITDQEELQGLVKKYKASATDADRIRRKLLKKLLNRFMDSLKSGKLVCFTSEVVKGSLAKKPSVSNVNEELITMMDDVAAATDENALVSQIDSSVAGHIPGKRSLYPPKQTIVPRTENATKLTTQIHDMTIGRFKPSKWSIFFWLLGLTGALLIILGVLTLSG